LVDGVFLEQGGISGDSTGPTNGSRSEKVWEPLVYSLPDLLSSLLFCSVANSSYNEYAKSNLKI